MQVCLGVALWFLQSIRFSCQKKILSSPKWPLDVVGMFVTCKKLVVHGCSWRYHGSGSTYVGFTPVAPAECWSECDPQMLSAGKASPATCILEQKNKISTVRAISNQFKTPNNSAPNFLHWGITATNQGLEPHSRILTSECLLAVKRDTLRRPRKTDQTIQMSRSKSISRQCDIYRHED